MTAPEYGDVAWIDLDPQAGHEQAKRRPALVLSPRSFNERFGLALFCPISSKPRGHAFEVAMPGGGTIDGVVVVHHIKSLDWRARRCERVCAAPPDICAAVADIVREMTRFR